MLDLNVLRLTDEELTEGSWYLYGEYPDGFKNIAEKQLAKALWGLEPLLADGGIITWEWFQSQLEGAGIRI